MGAFWSNSYVHISLCFTALCPFSSRAEWISPLSPTLSHGDSNMAIGHYQNRIIMLGGYQYPHDIIEYDMMTGSFITSSNDLEKETRGYSQFYAQMHDIMYIITWSGEYINIYDFSTNIYTQNWSIPLDLGNDACVASTSQELYIIGGYNSNSPDTVHILTISTNSWRDGPKLRTPRYWKSCVASKNNKLYIIAGATGQGRYADYLNTIEFISIIDIDANSWQYANNLTESFIDTTAVVYNTSIYIVGGENMDKQVTTKVHIIDTNTNTVSLSLDELSYGAAGMGVIVVGHTLYAFAGYTDTKGIYTNKWQYYDLATSNPTTTSTTLTTLTTVTNSESFQTSNSRVKYKEAAVVYVTTNQIRPPKKQSSSSDNLWFMLLLIALSVCAVACVAIAVLIRMKAKKKRQMYGESSKNMAEDQKQAADVNEAKVIVESSVDVADVNVNDDMNEKGRDDCKERNVKVEKDVMLEHDVLDKRDDSSSNESMCDIEGIVIPKGNGNQKTKGYETKGNGNQKTKGYETKGNDNQKRKGYETKGNDNQQKN